MLRKRIKRFALALSILLLAFMATSWFMAGALVAPSNCEVAIPQTEMPIEAFSLDSDSGSNLAGWVLKNGNSNRVVILLHPLRGDRRSMLERAKLLYESGFSVVLIDFQAHGESSGESITFGHLEKHDVTATVAYAKGMFPDCQIAVIGWSLGGASALLASPLRVDALILESVYPTISDAVYDRVDMQLGAGKYLAAPLLLWQLPIRLGISTDDLMPIEQVDRIDCPLMLLAGDRDLHTPLRESQTIFDAASEPKEFVVFEGATHEDLQRFDSLLYRERVIGFLQDHLRR